MNNLDFSTISWERQVICKAKEPVPLSKLKSLPEDYKVYIDCVLVHHKMYFTALIYKDGILAEIPFNAFFGVFDVQSFVDSKLSGPLILGF
mgnify:CR=1 FL=1